MFFIIFKNIFYILNYFCYYLFKMSNNWHIFFLNYVKGINKILKSSKEIKTEHKCQNCQIIRIFLLSVAFIIIIALIQSDKLHYLNFVTPLNAAISIISLGLIMFFIKLTKYFLEKKQN